MTEALEEEIPASKKIILVNFHDFFHMLKVFLPTLTLNMLPKKPENLLPVKRIVNIYDVSSPTKLPKQPDDEKPILIGHFDIYTTSSKNLGSKINLNALFTKEGDFIFHFPKTDNPTTL